MTLRRRLASVVIIAAAIVVQSSVFGRFRLDAIAPDVVALVLILVSLRERPPAAMVTAFVAGLAVDAISADALGLRASVYTAMVFLAVRTRERADAGPVAAAVWVGVLSLAAVIFLVLMGTLFGQIEWGGTRSLTAMVVVPTLNLVLALLLMPIVDRIQRPSVRFP